MLHDMMTLSMETTTTTTTAAASAAAAPSSAILIQNSNKNDDDGDQNKKTKLSSSSSLSMSTLKMTKLTPSPSLWSYLINIFNIYHYVLLCLLFGLFSLIIGVALFLLDILFRMNTTSIHLIESVPLYMPSLILFFNGLSLLLFMNKTTRRLYLLKSVCGLYLLITLLMIIIAITTSIIHLPRLQTHKECAYNVRIRACTCIYSPQPQQQQQQSNRQSIMNNNNDLINTNSNNNNNNDIENDKIPLFDKFKATKQFTMEDIMNCELVHGILYDSLKVVFALSLLAIFVSIISMLILYKLSLHEKRKLYLKNQLIMARDHHHYYYRSKLRSINDDDHNQKLNNCQSLPSTMTSTAFSTDFDDRFNNKLGKNFKCLSAKFSSQDLLIDNNNNNNNNNYSSNHNDSLKTTINNETADDPHSLLFSPTKKLDRQYKIWSSQSATKFSSPDSEHVDKYRNRTDSDNYDGNDRQRSNLRRYMSVILDTPSNVHSYVWRKLNSLKNIHRPTNDDANDSVKKFSDHNHQYFPPPHMAIPRFSVTNIKNDDFKLKNSTMMLKTSSSSSSSPSSTLTNESSSEHLTSNSSYCSKSQTIRYQLSANDNMEILIPSDEQHPIHYDPNQDLCSLDSNNANNILDQVEQSRTDFTSKYICHHMSSLDNSTSKNDSNSDDNRSNHCSYKYTLDPLVVNRFECIDEDEELCKEFNLQPIISRLALTTTAAEPFYFNPFETDETKTTKEQSKLYPSENILSKSLIHEQPQQQQQQQQPNLMDVFTFISSGGNNKECNNNNNNQIYTTFEEAFKNYYDSQNRISNNDMNNNYRNNFYTLPNKTMNNQYHDDHDYHHHHSHQFEDNRDRNHQYRHHQRRMQFVQQRQQQQPREQMNDYRKNTSILSQNHQKQNTIELNSKKIAESVISMNNGNKINQDLNNRTAFVDEIPSHVTIIEPPKGYQNFFPINNQITHQNNNIKPGNIAASTIEFSNKSYPNYNQQSISLNKNNMNDEANDDNDDDDDEEVDDEDDYDDDDDDDEDDEIDDGAGDTSTSQDLADFELELDEEPIKFVSEDDFKLFISNPNLIKFEDIFKHVNFETINLNAAQIINNQKPDQNDHSNHRNDKNTILAKLSANNQHSANKQNQKTIEQQSMDMIGINIELTKRFEEKIAKNQDTFNNGFNVRRVDDDDDNNDKNDDGNHNALESSSTTSTTSSTTTTTGTESSLSLSSMNRENSRYAISTDEENSITTEFIKPPTPFTNYII